MHNYTPTLIFSFFFLNLKFSLVLYEVNYLLCFSVNFKYVNINIFLMKKWDFP